WAHRGIRLRGEFRPQPWPASARLATPPRTLCDGSSWPYSCNGSRAPFGRLLLGFGLRRRAEHRAFESPAVVLRRRDLALAGDKAVVGLAVHAVVVEAINRHPVERAVAVGLRRLRLEGEPFVNPERARFHDGAFVRVDGEKM